MKCLIRNFPVNRTPQFSRPRQLGFSMIEVLVAILIVSVGLIGMALLQSTALKYSQSSNYRTQAVNLSSNLLEQVRANRAEAGSYVGTFTATSGTCASTGNSVPSATFINEWRCQMHKQLGAGAKAVVSRTNNQIQVQITWADSWWEADSTKQKYTFTAATQI